MISKTIGYRGLAYFQTNPVAVSTPLRHHLGGEPDQHHLSVKARDAADGLTSAAVCCNGWVLLGNLFTGNQDVFSHLFNGFKGKSIGKHRFSHFKWGFPVLKFSQRSIDCNHQRLDQRLGSSHKILRV